MYGAVGTAAIVAALALQPGIGTVIPLLFPVMVAAYFGGLWPGLTISGVANTAAIFLAKHSGSTVHDIERLGSLFAASVLCAIASEALHRARDRALHAAETAQASDQRFAQMFIGSPVAKSLSRLDNGEVVDVNPAYLSLFGLRLQQIVGSTPRNAGIVTSSDTRAQLFSMLKAGGELTPTEVQVTSADGRTLALLVSSHVITLDDQRLALSSFVDLTERKRAEQQARLADSRLREFAENVDSAFFLVDVRRGKMLYVSKGYEQLWGRTVDMKNPMDWLEGVHPDDRVRKSDELHRLEAVHASEYRIVRPDGEVRWIHTKLSPIRDEHGVLIQVAGISEDISDKRAAEQAVHESEQRFLQIAEVINEVVWMMDTTGHLLYTSPVFRRVFGREPVGGMWLAALHPEDHEQTLVAVERGLETGTFDIRYRIVRPDGDIRWIRDRAFPIRDKAGVLVRVAGIAADITDQLRVDEKLLQGQKLESIGLLAGGVAHDFNNILCVITANSEMLAESIPANHPDRVLVEQIDASAERARSLTQQLLAFSRKQVTQTAVLDLNKVVEDTLRMLRRMLGEEIRLRVVLDPQVGQVRVDAGQIAQVLMNLCVNARDAMVPHGGEIAIETTAHPDGALLSVSDDGPGMPDDVKARAFEPFFTTKEVGKGTGLGLAVVHGIVAQANGSIEIDSQLGRGTSVRIRLPSAVGTASVRESQRIAGRGSERILLVDDDGPLRATSARALAKRGYKVTEACDGLDALRVLRTGTTFDLLITDVVMPAMNGRELAEAALGEKPELRVLFTSGYPDDDIMRRGIQQREVAFLEKPFGASTLALKVREVLSAPR